MKPVWYLSFVKSGEFIGGCMVKAWTMEQAVERTWRLRINPGGEVVGLPVEAGLANALPHNRLLSLRELKRHGEVFSYKELFE
jgi:hypothetical protein